MSEEREIHRGLCPQPQVQVGDDAEGAKAAGVQFGQVIAGDIFHHPSARRDQPRCTVSRERGRRSGWPGFVHGCRR